MQVAVASVTGSFTGTAVTYMVPTYSHGLNLLPQNLQDLIPSTAECDSIWQ